MTTKVNGAAYPGIWVEKKVAFVKLTFNTDISALAASALTVLGTATAAGTGAVADSTFGVVESAVVQALKTLETKSTVLGVSRFNVATLSIDVMLGVSEGWFSDVNGVIATGLPVLNAQAIVTTAGAAPTATVGALVSVTPASVTFSLEFVAFDGSLPVATAAAGYLVLGPGATSGAYIGQTPYNPSTGAAGYYPAPI